MHVQHRERWVHNMGVRRVNLWLIQPVWTERLKLTAELKRLLVFQMKSFSFLLLAWPSRLEQLLLLPQDSSLLPPPRIVQSARRCASIQAPADLLAANSTVLIIYPNVSQTLYLCTCQDHIKRVDVTCRNTVGVRAGSDQMKRLSSCLWSFLRNFD